MSNETISTTDTDLTFAEFLDLWATVHKCIYTGIVADGRVCIRGTASPEAVADLLRRAPADLWIAVDRRPAPTVIGPADRGLFGWALAEHGRS